MNNIYIYEGDFISLLNTITYLIKNKKKPDNIKNDLYAQTLLDNIFNLSIPKNEKIIEEVRNHFGKYVLRIMYCIFLSEAENKELIIFYLFKNALKYQDKVLYYRNLKCVSEGMKIANYVIHESHKMKGFLRFKELENKVLYAEMAPTNNILFLVSKHFQNRLKNEYWMIKDVNRKLISIYDKKNFFIVLEEELKDTMEEESESEKMVENLWINFYKTIGIKERKNDRCRMNFMPKKYWKYITEVREEI